MNLRHPWRATVAALVGALVLTWAGVPPEGGIGLGVALGWLIASTWPDRHERYVPEHNKEDYLWFYE